MKHKIDFGIIFIISILIIFFSKVWGIIGNYPEAFKYGSIIYQIIDVILYVLSNLSIGVAASIIFYYTHQLIEKKKNFQQYVELRKILLFMFYNHLKVLSKIHNFREINQRDRDITAILFPFDIYDIPVLVRLYGEIKSEEQKTDFKKNLMDFFLNMNEQDLNDFSNSFKKNLEELKKMQGIRFFKNSNELIVSLCNSYYDEFYIAAGISRENNDLTGIAELIADDYILFLDDTMDLYLELIQFIDSIEKKRIIKFIKMLD